MRRASLRRASGTRPHLRPVGKVALAACAAAERVARAAKERRRARKSSTWSVPKRRSVVAKELDMERASTSERDDGLADELGHNHPAQLLRVTSLACTSGAAAMDCAREGSSARAGSDACSLKQNGVLLIVQYR